MWETFVIFMCLSLNSYSNNFVDAFLSHPDRMERAAQNEETRELLEKYKPRIYVNKKSYLPVDFYMDYLPKTQLKKDGMIASKISGRVTREELVKYSEKDGYFLDFKGDYRKYLKREVEVNPAIYGRVYKDKIGSESYIFLKYNLAFPYSGLPADISKGKKVVAGMLGKKMAWHQLDIHGAYHLVVRERDMKPIGVLINQHNHHKVYIIGKDYNLPKDGRGHVAIAQYSNEPYLWKGTEETIRTAGDPRNIEYLFYRSEKVPLDGGRDYLGGVEEMEETEVTLYQLPLDDPLYTSKISLGNKKKILFFFNLWYLNGPPGMDYYSYPELKNLGDLFSFWYIDPEDDDFFQYLSETRQSLKEFNIKKAFEYQRERMIEILSKTSY